jgi:hypothetical protein
MKLEKAPPEVLATFERVFPDDPRAERRLMFGYPSGFVNGNMWGGVFATSLVLRLPAGDRQRLVERRQAEPFEPMPGRPMKEYVLLAPHVVQDADAVRPWVQRAFDHVAAMPPKAPKAPKGLRGPKKAQSARGTAQSVRRPPPGQA